jgi:glycosyltransferase involved in cell wall biosynthesis
VKNLTPVPSALRFGVFVDQFPELSETFIASELHELRRLGHAVHVETARHAPNPRDAAAGGLDVAYLADDDRAERVRALLWLATRHPLGVLRDLVDRRRWRRQEKVRRLRQLAPAARRVASLRADHLHAHFAAGAALDAMRVARLLGVPYSLATHGYDIFQAPANLAEKHERAAFAVSACDYSVSYLRGVLPAATGERVHRLVVGVDGERFRRTSEYPGGRTVVAVARLIEKKGLRDLVAAAARLQARGTPARVRIVGDGPQHDELRALMDELGTDGSVELLGPRDPAGVQAILEEADLLAMPCVVAANGDRDTMPVVVKEALAMELPVVATDEVGLPEVVKPGWGRLVPPHAPDALADAIEELLALPRERRAEMGRAGREFVLAECNLTRETERLVELVRAHDRPA